MKRLGSLGALTALLFTTLIFAGPPAQAAWFTNLTTHGAKAQTCKVSIDRGTRLKVRVNNRKGTQRVAVFLRRVDANYREKEIVWLRVPKGEVSMTKSLVLTKKQRRKGHSFQIGTKDFGGDAGGSLTPRC
ncbi:hypothetical protein ASG90_07910 [Nocardioides sp. Soil797]|nr:hypothetical protein ASG90_07910 [Nocardioides sp. Soil797]